MKRALELNKETDGAFDIAIYPVMEAWGFPTQISVCHQLTTDRASEACGCSEDLIR